MIFNKDIKIIQWGKRITFQQIVLRQMDSYMKKNEVECLPKKTNEKHPNTKMNSKWINLNIRAEMIKLLEENTGVNLHDLRFGKGFLDLTLKA